MRLLGMRISHHTQNRLFGGSPSSSSLCLGISWSYLSDSNIAKFVFAIVVAPRLYLVLEAFISVRSLPVGAYQTVDWVGFLPHIG